MCSPRPWVSYRPILRDRPKESSQEQSLQCPDPTQVQRSVTLDTQKRCQKVSTRYPVSRSSRVLMVVGGCLRALASWKHITGKSREPCSISQPSHPPGAASSPFHTTAASQPKDELTPKPFRKFSVNRTTQMDVETEPIHFTQDVHHTGHGSSIANNGIAPVNGAQLKLFDCTLSPLTPESVDRW